MLEERLRGRGTETESSIQKRLEQAAREMEYAFDSSEGSSSSVHDYVIFNDDLEKAFAELEEWVYQPPPTDVTSGKTEEGKEKV